MKAFHGTPDQNCEQTSFSKKVSGAREGTKEAQQKVKEFTNICATSNLKFYSPRSGMKAGFRLRTLQSHKNQLKQPILLHPS